MFFFQPITIFVDVSAILNFSVVGAIYVQKSINLELTVMHMTHRRRGNYFQEEQREADDFLHKSFSVRLKVCLHVCVCVCVWADYAASGKVFISLKVREKEQTNKDIRIEKKMEYI